MNQERTRKVGMCLDSPTKFTHFTPLSSEVRQPIGSFSLAKFFRRNKDPPGPSPKTADATLPKVDPRTIHKEPESADQMHNNTLAKDYWTNTNNRKSDNVPASGQTSVNRDHERDIVYTRSLTNVLRRISSIRDKRSTAPQSYKDSDFKQYWMPDSNCKECYECGDKFTTFRRRHHCRVCGQIFCSRCCNQAIPGKLMGYSGDLRVCTHCCRIVLSYIQSSELGADLKTLQEELHNKLILLNPFSDNSTYDFGSRTSLRRKNSVGFREEEFARMRYSSSSDISFSSSSNFMSVDQMSTERKNLAQDSVQLRELWAEMQDPVNGVEFQNHRHRLRTFPNCVVGKELVDWLISMDKASTREQATAIGQALVDAKLLDCVTNQDELFLDEYALYKPSQHVSIESPILTRDQCENSSLEESQDPSWVKEICPDEEEIIENELDIVKNDEWSVELIEKDVVTKDVDREEANIVSSSSMFTLQLDFEENRAILTKPKSSENSMITNVGNEYRREFLSSLDLGVQQVRQNLPNMTLADEFLKGALPVNKVQQNNEDITSPLGWYNPEHLDVENGEKLAYERLIGAYSQHEQLLLRQLLSVEGLSMSWYDIIIPIVHKVSEVVRPDVKNDNDEMDIRQYVQFKKIPGGKKSDCNIINGAVCSKNIAHKKMRNRIQNPSILILSSPIVYQRQENKLLSLDPLVMQEYSYLKNFVLKIASFKPDIVLVEKTVSRLAQDFLLEQGITLVLNVKPSVTERVARCTQAYIISSIDAQITRPQLGICPDFYVLEHHLPNGKTKTLMYFDGCATHLGCTVTLRGATNAELRKVKKIMQFMVYVAYNRRLERSFLMDEFAMPPASPDEIPLIIGEEDEFESCDDEIQFKDDDSYVFIEQSVGSIDISDNEAEVGRNKTKNSENICNIHVDNGFKSVLNDVNDLQVSQGLVEPNSSSKNFVSSQNDNVDSDNRISKMEIQQIDDFSDPLHTLLHSDEENDYRRGSSQLHVAPLPFVNTFRKALDDMILSCSPYMKYSVPYLESDQGRNCELRLYFLDEIYWSIHFHKDKNTVKKKPFSDSNDEQLPTYDTLENGYLSDDVIVIPWHPFITHRLTRQFNDDQHLRGLLSDFRARGGRIYRLCPHQLKEKQKEQKNVDNMDLAEKESLSNAGLLWERQVDALDPFYHQRLVVLFCSYSHVSNNTPNFCVNPRIVNMDFYGCNDITLGGFLERYCFRQAYACPSSSCETPMTDHIRKFAHENGCVQILLRQMEDPSPICQNTIAMWSWCRHCSQGTPFIPMSLDSWSFSFAKYLELRFHGKLYTRRGAVDACCHSLHHDYYQYFGYKDRVVAFKYSQIILREFAFPPLVIVKKERPIPHSEIIDEIKHLAVDGNDVYSTVLQWLIDMKHCYINTKHEAYFSELMAQQEEEHNVFREKIEEIQLKLTSPTLENNHLFADSQPLQKSKRDEQKDPCQLMWKIHDCVVNVKRLIADAASTWNAKKQEFIQQRKKEERPARLASGVARLISTSGSTSGADTVSPKSFEDGTVPNTNLDSSAEGAHPDEQKIPPPLFTVCGCAASSGAESVQSEEGDVFCNVDSKVNDEKHIDDSLDSSLLSANAFCKETDISGNADCLSHSGSDPLLAKSSTPPLESIDPIHSSPKVFAKKRSLTDFTTIQNFILKNFTDIVPEITSDSIDNASDLSYESRKTENRGHERSRSEGDGRLLSDIRLKIPLAKTEDDVSDAPRIEKKAGTVKTRLTQMLSSTPTDTIPIPFPATEHHLLPKCEKVPVVVYENEIGSIIAYALSSVDYEHELQDLRAALSSSQRDSLANSPVTKKKHMKSSDKDQASSHDTVTTSENSGNLWKTGMLAFFRGGERSNIRLFQTAQSGSGFESVLYSATGSDLDLLDWEEVDEKDNQLYNNPDPDKVLRTNNNKISPEFHITVEFADATSKFYCKVYFAEQFRKLRKFIYPYGEEAYIRSLSRCINWQAKGGKSGLTFCKTQDDRFILKQMSRLEFPSFMDFAPNYFQHIMRAFADQKPTVLAKIVGIYRISYRNSQTNAASRLDLLVIENLFYSRNITQKFDLKGSVRNRLVNTTGKQDGELVLLDENLLKMTCDNPLYIRPHSKTVLSLAINNDTQFLSRQKIMDYSLLVGIDEDKQELVIGIIDYVRTFTFDKKIEMVVKSSGFLGGQGKMPTVVSPELYRKRFCEAMDRYFLHVPDRWSGLGRGVDC